MSTPEKLNLIRRIFWDYHLDDEDLKEILKNHHLPQKGISKKDFYQKLLKSYSWFTLLDFFGYEKLLEIIDNEQYIKGLFPSSLEQAYKNAARVLSE